MIVSADRIVIDGDTGWWVQDQQWGWLSELNRPCETCDGTGKRQFVPAYEGGPPRSTRLPHCPDCINGRHTFDLSVEQHRGFFRTAYRAAIIEVLPIIEPLPESGFQIHDSPAIFSDPNWRGEWFKRTARGDVDGIGPKDSLPAAAPGMHAVRLAVRHG